MDALPQANPGAARLADAGFLRGAGAEAGLPFIEGCVAHDSAQAGETVLLMGVPLLVQGRGPDAPRAVMRVRHLEDLPLALSKVLRPGCTVLLRRPPEGPEWVLAGLVRDGQWAGMTTGWLRRADNDFPVHNALWLGDIPEPVAQAVLAVLSAAGCRDGVFEVRGPVVSGRPELEMVCPYPDGASPLLALSRLAGVGDKVPNSCLAPLRPAARVWLNSHSGVVEAVEGVNAASQFPGLVEVHAGVTPGDTLGHVVDEPSRDRLGWVTALGDTPEEALERAEAAAALIHIRTRPLR